MRDGKVAKLLCSEELFTKNTFMHSYYLKFIAISTVIYKNFIGWYADYSNF